jgi:FkbM family methyltransferase
VTTMMTVESVFRSMTLRGLSWLCRSSADRNPLVEDAKYRILAGPIRGAVLSMPRLERPSYLIGTYERHVIQTLKEHVNSGDIVYDIGANIGYITLVLAQLVGTKGAVFAFEPDSVNRAALLDNICRIGARHAQVVPAAVSDSSGHVQFASFEYSLVGHIATSTTPHDASLSIVPSISLDDFVYRDQHPIPSLLKVDVEGAETEVFRGAARLLDEARPIVIAEVRSGTVWSEVTHLFATRGYDHRILEGGAARRPEAGLVDALFIPTERLSGLSKRV